MVEHPVIEVLRRELATKVVRDGRGAFLGKNPKHDPHFVIRHVLSRHDRGETEVYSRGHRSPAPIERPAAHSNGVIEHAFGVAGRIEISVGDVVEQLDEGDRMTFLADRPHIYRALDNRAARFVVLLDYPR